MKSSLATAGQQINSQKHPMIIAYAMPASNSFIVSIAASRKGLHRRDEAAEVRGCAGVP